MMTRKVYKKGEERPLPGGVEKPPTKQQLSDFYVAKRQGMSDTQAIKEIGKYHAWLTKWREDVDIYIKKRTEIDEKRDGQKVMTGKKGRPVGTCVLSIDPRIWFKYGQLDMSPDEISRQEGVSKMHLSTFLNRRTECKRALEEGRADLGNVAINALRKRAGGYKRVKKQYFAFQGRVLDERDHVEHVEPDVNAAMHILVNKRNWKRGDKDSTTDNKSAILSAIAQLTEGIDNGEDDFEDDED